MIHNFHPLAAKWFIENLGEPTPVQVASWKAIQNLDHTLIAAPTGSGKTMAAFFHALDSLCKQSIEGNLMPGVKIVYISPLKALSNDIDNNLRFPLKGLKEVYAQESGREPEVRVGLRTGDTPPSERQAMVKNPPHILVTTPESLYLLLTSEGGRNMLSTTETVIVDEIHALAGDKRGSHMLLTLERLSALVDGNLQRIGISATQKPIEKIAHYLVGQRFKTNSDEINCTIVDTGHKRHIDINLEVPNSELTALMANEVWGEIYDRLEELVKEHKTTLIFVNTRRLAERIAHNLTERMGEEVITAHHGSMSKEHRHQAEAKLKSGNLKALVATASMELGIDIGAVDLVCQIGSPKSIAAFLQRVGRSGHTVKGTPKGKLFPLTRDELIESVALFDAVKRGELDAIVIPEKPLDILAQQIIAEISAGERPMDKLFEMFHSAFPFRHLEKKEFMDVLKMCSEGYATRRGRQGSYLHLDRINHIVKPRKNARLTALINGGAIPDNFEFDVLLEPSNTYLGTLNEDFAVESMPGDIIQLGNNSWLLLRVETGKVYVADAQGLPPTIPFWFGEAPGRTKELSEAVSRFREDVSQLINIDEIGPPPEKELVEDLHQKDDSLPAVAKAQFSKGRPLSEITSSEPWRYPSFQYLTEKLELLPEVADQVITYLGATKAALGAMPTRERIILERFFDDAGDMHLVIHSPFGSRLNRGWGLALRKKFCRKFNFELQAAATEDSIILSLGSTHSFPLDEVFKYLNPKGVKDTLVQALLDAPMFEVRWRWNASRALAIRRRNGNKKVPPQIQRMQSEDLISLVFPDQLACLENIVGEREVPDHPLVNQTVHDCLTEAMDIDELEELVTRIVNIDIELLSRDLREPSPMSQEIINARPYAYLDPAPAEERRTNAVKNRTWIDPAEAKEFGSLSIEAIERVIDEVEPFPETPDELHETLMINGFLSEEEIQQKQLDLYVKFLEQENRIVTLQHHSHKIYVATERLPEFLLAIPETTHNCKIPIPDEWMEEVKNSGKDHFAEVLRNRMECMGPFTIEGMQKRIGIFDSRIQNGLLVLENDGFVFRGCFTPDSDEEEWCERRILARIHRYTLQTIRKQVQPVSPKQFMQFLFAWQGLTPDRKRSGENSVKPILQQLEGFHTNAAAWEADILPARIFDYDPIWLDKLSSSGKVMWGRFFDAPAHSESKGPGSLKSGQIAFLQRGAYLDWMKIFGPKREEDVQLTPNAEKVYNVLKEYGACFFDELVGASGIFESQTEEGLKELVYKGLALSDNYAGLRSLMINHQVRKRRKKKSASFSLSSGGRWTLVKPYLNNPKEETEFFMAKRLLDRYGIIFRKLADREPYCPPWRELVRQLRVMEARGIIRGGRFVEGMYGEQFALNEAVALLKKTRLQPDLNQIVTISAADPLNLVGIITPGKKVNSYYKNRLLYKDGIPIVIKEGKEEKWLVEVNDEEKWNLHALLVKRPIPPSLLPYLGKN